MTIKKILEEIESIDISTLGDGLSFADHFIANRSISPIENLLFYSDCKKYYYNFSEKRLRKLICLLDKITDLDDPNNIVFNCKDLENEPDIDLKADSFADKIVCYEDYHKVVTYDPDTKHYECFFADMSKQKVEKFNQENPLQDEIEIEGIDIDNSPEVVEAFKTICTYLYKSRNELSEIRFIDMGDGIKVDLISSKFYPDDKMNNSASIS